MQKLEEQLKIQRAAAQAKRNDSSKVAKIVASTTTKQPAPAASESCMTSRAVWSLYVSALNKFQSTNRNLLAKSASFVIIVQLKLFQLADSITVKP